MSKRLLEKFIRVRITEDDRRFIDQYILDSGLTISELFRSMIIKLKQNL
jgi:hypothetical protein